MGASKGNSDRKKPKAIRRSKTSTNSTTKTEDNVMDITIAQTDEMSGMATDPAPANEHLTASATTMADDLMTTTTVEPAPTTTALPPLPGYNLDGVSRNQQYIIRNMLLFADCAVQISAEGVFDVLARNFSDTGALVWWLWRVGKRDLATRIKRMDIVDAARITAHALHQQIKAEIGGKLPRW
jgi:hypothetical protein